MRKLTWIKSLLLISAVTSISFPVSSGAFANLVGDSSNSANILISQNNKGQKSSVLDWFRKIFRRTGKGAPNRGPFCSIWPNKDAYNLLNTASVRLFIWRAEDNVNVKIIEIKDSNKSEIWSHNLTENEQKEQRIIYNGSPLKPGEYIYKIIYETPLNGKNTVYSETIDFEVIKHNNSLSLEAKTNEQTKYKQDLTTDNLAMQQVDNLLDKKLIADAIQEIFLVKNTSSDWNSGLNEFRTMFCPLPEE